MSWCGLFRTRSSGHRKGQRFVPRRMRLLGVAERLSPPNLTQGFVMFFTNFRRSRFKVPGTGSNRRSVSVAEVGAATPPARRRRMYQHHHG